MFLSVQKCRQTEHEVRDSLQDKYSFPYIPQIYFFSFHVGKKNESPSLEAELIFF